MVLTHINALVFGFIRTHYILIQLDFMCGKMGQRTGATPSEFANFIRIQQHIGQL
jgi:hypothetical protein